MNLTGFKRTRIQRRGSVHHCQKIRDKMPSQELVKGEHMHQVPHSKQQTAKWRTENRKQKTENGKRHPTALSNSHAMSCHAMPCPQVAHVVGISFFFLSETNSGTVYVHNGGVSFMEKFKNAKRKKGAPPKSTGGEVALDGLDGQRTDMMAIMNTIAHHLWRLNLTFLLTRYHKCHRLDGSLRSLPPAHWEHALPPSGS